MLLHDVSFHNCPIFSVSEDDQSEDDKEKMWSKMEKSGFIFDYELNDSDMKYRDPVYFRSYFINGDVLSTPDGMGYAIDIIPQKFLYYPRQVKDPEQLFGAVEITYHPDAKWASDRKIKIVAFASSGLDRVKMYELTMFIRKGWLSVASENELDSYRIPRMMMGIINEIQCKVALQHEIEYFQPTEKDIAINRRRLKDKKLPIFEIRKVKLDTGVRFKIAPKGGTHASPREHDRRGHWRISPKGKKVWVRQCKVGDASRGRVVHEYHV